MFHLEPLWDREKSLDRKAWGFVLFHKQRGNDNQQEKFFLTAVALDGVLEEYGRERGEIAEEFGVCWCVRAE